MLLENFEYKEIIAKLREREKELKCLYKVQEIINDNLPVDDFLMEVAKHIWGGWQYPMITRVKITFEDKTFREPGWTETQWVHRADIIIDDMVLGKIEVFYTEFIKLVTDSQFLPEEQRLLDTIAAKVSTYIFNLRLVKTLEAIANGNKTGDMVGSTDTLLPVRSDIHWLWRNEMVRKIAEKFDPERFGVEAMYLIGSTKNATAGPASDIDILIHFKGDPFQEKELRAWFEGWSYCLSEINLARTGYKTNGLIDLHIITDEDIIRKDSFASLIGSLYDRAKPLRQREND
jgi:predicted nucleotidyltransferase